MRCHLLSPPVLPVQASFVFVDDRATLASDTTAKRNHGDGERIYKVEHATVTFHDGLRTGYRPCRCDCRADIMFKNDAPIEVTKDRFGTFLSMDSPQRRA